MILLMVVSLYVRNVPHLIVGVKNKIILTTRS
nr:MAG TPA: hypothetical protein [Caudoviricetes sp.]